MSNLTYKAALIGAGRIGMLLENDPKRLKPATHFGMWDDHPKFDLVAVCDPDPEKLKIAESIRPDIKTYTDSDVMLGEVRPDAISVATWKNSHYDMMRLALAHKVPAVVLEKPIAERKDHALEIVEAAEAQGMHLLVNHRRRFDPLLYPLMRDLKNGLVGELLQVSSYYVYGLVTTGTHLIDTLRLFLKDIAGDICWVVAMPAAFCSFHPDDDPGIDGILGFENGLKATIQSLSIKDYDIFEINLFGRSGKVCFKNIGRDIDIYRIIPSEEHEGFTELETNPSEHRGGAPRAQFRSMADNVIQCLEGRGESLSTGRDSLIALEVLIAMQESSAAGGQLVKLK